MSIRSQEQVALLTDFETTSAYNEAFRSLYANIRFNWDSEQSKQHTLLLTTPTAYAAQTIVAANVAIAAAQSGTATILVDADLRTPSLGQRFGTGDHAGFGDLLAEKTLDPHKLDQYLSTTFIPGLRLLGAGDTQGGPALLLSATLQKSIEGICQFLADTETAPSLVIFNSPPVLAGPDASLIAAQVKQTILTIAKGRTTRAKAKQAQEQLERAHARLVGIVMLDV